MEHHIDYMRLAISEAKKCEPTQTAFCVGALLVDALCDPPTSIVATGFSRELPGNTHAEQCCLEKLRKGEDGIRSEKVYVLYTTMEPCSKRLSGNKSCVERIIEFERIKTVYIGCMEPDVFVKNNVAKTMLAENDIEYILVPGLEEECLNAAKKGHA